MEKIIFAKVHKAKERAIAPHGTRKPDHPVRLEKEIYLQMKEISEQTKVPLTHVISTILARALPYVEVI